MRFCLIIITILSIFSLLFITFPENVYAISDRELDIHTLQVDILQIDDEVAQHYVNNNIKPLGNDIIDKLIAKLYEIEETGCDGIKGKLMLPVSQAITTLSYMGDKGYDKLIKLVDSDNLILKTNILMIFYTMLLRGIDGTQKFRPEILDVFVKELDNEKNMLGRLGSYNTFAYRTLGTCLRILHLNDLLKNDIEYTKTPLDQFRKNEKTRKINKLKNWWKQNYKLVIKKIHEHIQLEKSRKKKKYITRDMYESLLINVVWKNGKWEIVK